MTGNQDAPSPASIKRRTRHRNRLSRAIQLADLAKALNGASECPACRKKSEELNPGPYKRMGRRQIVPYLKRLRAYCDGMWNDVDKCQRCPPPNLSANFAVHLKVGDD